MKLKDMKETEAWKGGTMLPIGYHTVVIQSAEETLTSNDNPQFELEFSNDLGSIRDWLVYVPATAGKVKQLLDAVGIESQDGEMEVNASQLEGRKLMIHIHEEIDQRDPSKMRRRVGEYSPVGTSPGNGGGPTDEEPMPF